MLLPPGVGILDDSKKHGNDRELGKHQADNIERGTHSHDVNGRYVFRRDAISDTTRRQRDQDCDDRDEIEELYF